MELSLAHLTALSLSPPQLINTAAEVGFRSVGLRLVKVTPESPAYPLMDDPAVLRATRSALSDTGVTVSDIEFVMITPTLDVGSLEPLFETGALLGASNVIVAPYDPDRTRLIERFSALCALGARYSMGVMMEFFPWAEIKSLKEASAFIRDAAQPNGGVLVDSLHFMRSGSSFEELSRIPPARLPFVHLCDAPAAPPGSREGLLFQAREERLPPGEGGLDLVGFLRHLPSGTSLALEVPMMAFTREAGAPAAIKRVYDATASLLRGNCL